MGAHTPLLEKHALLLEKFVLHLSPDKELTNQEMIVCQEHILFEGLKIPIRQPSEFARKREAGGVQLEPFVLAILGCRNHGQNQEI